jgi:ABC-type lipopolysaccharide export system ATPase subunit
MKTEMLLSALAAVALGVGMGPAMADVKVGFVGPLSGPVGAVGQDQIDGFTLAVEELDGQLGGQVTTVLKEDDQLKPEAGTQAVQTLIDKDKVDAIVGLGFSNGFSGCEQQMLAIGPALLTNPLLVLNEATEGLAPLMPAQIWHALAKLKEEGPSLIVIDKNIGALLDLARRHFVLEKGSVVWRGGSSALRAEPAIIHQCLGV